MNSTGTEPHFLLLPSHADDPQFTENSKSTRETFLSVDEEHYCAPYHMQKLVHPNFFIYLTSPTYNVSGFCGF